MNLKSLLLGLLLLVSSVHVVAGPQVLSEDYQQVTVVTQLEEVTALWEYGESYPELAKVSLDSQWDFYSQNYLFLRHQYLLAEQVRNQLATYKLDYLPPTLIPVHSTISRTTEDDDSTPLT